MKIKKFWLRDKQEISVDIVKTWEVRWTSRYGGFSGDTRKEAMFFPKETDAREFKDALEAAFKLIRHTSNTRVSLSSRGE